MAARNSKLAANNSKLAANNSKLSVKKLISVADKSLIDWKNHFCKQSYIAICMLTN